MRKAFKLQGYRVLLLWAAIAAFLPGSAAALTCGSVPTTIGGAPAPVVAGSGDLSMGNGGTISDGTGDPVKAVGNGTSVTTSAGVQTPGQTLPPFLPTTFPANSVTNDVSLNGTTLAQGSYDQVTIANTVTFSGGIYNIKTISGDNNVTLRMAAGDYFVETFSVGNNSQLIVTSGPVRIFIKTSLQSGNDPAFNASGNVADLQIFLYDNAALQFGNSDQANTSADFKGLIYAPGANTSVQLGNNNDIQGAVLTGGSVSLGNNTDLLFDPTTQAAIAGINSCGLIADYHFDECAYNGTANEIVSSSGGIHASSKGNKASTASGGIVDRYFKTDSLNEYAQTTSTIPVPGSYTLSLWLKTPPPAPGGNEIYASASLASNGGCKGDFLNFRSDTGYKWRVYNSADGGVNGTYSISGISAGWHHFAVVGQGGNSTLYVDGASKGTVGILANGGGANNGLGYIGTSCDDTSNQAIRMPMDEFMLFRTPLTATDISDIYNAQRLGKNYDGSARTPSVCTGLHHLEIRHTGQGLTCTPAQVTVRACANADCSSLITSGATVTLSPGGTSFTIGSSGSATTTVSQTTAGTTALSVSAVTPTQSSDHTCVNTVDSTTSCNMTFNDSGFAISAPNHLSCTGQTLTISAVKKSDTTQKCVSAFDNGATRSIQLRFSYDTPLPTDDPALTTAHVPHVGSVTSGNPASGTALSTDSDATLNLTFTGGDATTGFLYQDAGSIKVKASYTGSAGTGDAGLSMTGTSSAIVVAPATFTVSVPAAPLTAGTPFATTVTAKNACATPTTTSNFGKTGAPVTVDLTSSTPLPDKGYATDIADTLSIAGNGTGSKDLTWNEVGLVDITASLSSYLGWTLPTPASGSATAGRFKPHHFETVVTPGCGGTFSYAGQNFTVATTAYRQGGSGSTGITNNYDGATTTYPLPRYANSVTLSMNPSTTGTLVNGSHAASDFAHGVATRNDIKLTLTDPRTPPLALVMRATETAGDGVTSNGSTEGTANIRSGRARLLNANGSDQLDLPMTLRSEYWASATGGWQTNTADTCTDASIALTDGTLLANKTCVLDTGNPGNSNAGCATAGLSARQFKETGVAGFAGDFNLWLRAPGTGNTGTVNVTVTVPDWLKFNWTGTLGNPVGKASFGRFGSKRVIHIFER